jgi:hypothetical protein
MTDPPLPCFARTTTTLAEVIRVLHSAACREERSEPQRDPTSSCRTADTLVANSRTVIRRWLRPASVPTRYIAPHYGVTLSD